MEEHLHAGFFNHAVHQVLGTLRINRWLPMGFAFRSRIRPCDMVAHGDGTAHEFLANATSDEPIFAVLPHGCRHHEKHHSVREKPAQRTVAFDKRRLRPSPRRRKRGGEPSGATTDDQNIRLMQDRDLTRRSHHLAIDHLAARAIGHRRLQRENVLAIVCLARIAATARRKLAAVGDKLVAKHLSRGRRKSTNAQMTEKGTFRQIHFHLATSFGYFHCAPSAGHVRRKPSRYEVSVSFQ